MTLKNINYLAFGSLALCVLGAWFYWFEVRPANIRIQCEKVAVNAAQKENQRSNPYAEDSLFQKDDYSLYYQMCTRSKGL